MPTRVTTTANAGPDPAFVTARPEARRRRLGLLLECVHRHSKHRTDGVPALSLSEVDRTGNRPCLDAHLLGEHAHHPKGGVRRDQHGEQRGDLDGGEEGLGHGSAPVPSTERRRPS